LLLLCLFIYLINKYLISFLFDNYSKDELIKEEQLKTIDNLSIEYKTKELELLLEKKYLKKLFDNQQSWDNQLLVEQNKFKLLQDFRLKELDNLLEKKNNVFILNKNFKKIACDLKKNKELLVFFKDIKNQNNYLAKTLEFLNEH
jgi:hypothetical protein